MTYEEVHRALSRYSAVLAPITPAQCPRDQYVHGLSTIVLEHLRWMLDQIDTLQLEGHHDKVMRWCGFIQGVMWANGICTLNELDADATGDLITKATTRS